MRDRANLDEFNFDTSGASDREVEACMGEAMDDLVWRLLDGKKIGYPAWGLYDFLDGLQDSGVLSGIVSRAMLANEKPDDEITRQIRMALTNTETLIDRAAAIANERGERE
jgi:hypothetical protein